MQMQHHLCSVVHTQNRFQALEEEVCREDAAEGEQKRAKSRTGGAGRTPTFAAPGRKREPREGGGRSVSSEKSSQRASTPSTTSGRTPNN